MKSLLAAVKRSKKNVKRKKKSVMRRAPGENKILLDKVKFCGVECRVLIDGGADVCVAALPFVDKYSEFGTHMKACAPQTACGIDGEDLYCTEKVKGKIQMGE